MRIFLTTVAGSATRFSESVGKPTVKCIFNREDPKKTLLNHMLTQAKDYDVYVIVGGYVATAWNDFVQGLIMLLGIVLVIAAVLNGKAVYSRILIRRKG